MSTVPNAAGGGSGAPNKPAGEAEKASGAPAERPPATRGTAPAVAEKKAARSATPLCRSRPHRRAVGAERPAEAKQGTRGPASHEGRRRGSRPEAPPSWARAPSGRSAARSKSNKTRGSAERQKPHKGWSRSGSDNPTTTRPRASVRAVLGLQSAPATPAVSVPRASVRAVLGLQSAPATPAVSDPRASARAVLGLQSAPATPAVSVPRAGGVPCVCVCPRACPCALVFVSW